MKEVKMYRVTEPGNGYSREGYFEHEIGVIEDWVEGTVVELMTDAEVEAMMSKWSPR